MPLQFIIGRAGTGKTHWCLTRIVQSLQAAPTGSPIYWILPKQATFLAERQLTCQSGLAGFSRVRIVSFEWLGQEILSTTEGAAIPQISAGGRQMILGHLLRKHAGDLKYYRSSARQAGLTVELDGAFTEFERRGVLPADLHRTAESNDADPALLGKLHDLSLLYDAHQQFLGQERIDPHRRNRLILEQAARCAAIANSDIYIDSFYDFTEHQRQLILAMAQQCANVTVTLLADPKSPAILNPDSPVREMSLFRRTEEQFQLLMRQAHKLGTPLKPPVLLEKTYRFRSDSLAHLENHLFKQPAQRFTKPADIQLIEAHSRRAEIDAAARQIRQWLRDGYRMRDIAVLMRDINTYHDLLSASFTEHRIPFFIDRRRSAGYHPLPQLVRAVIEAALRGFPRESMLTLIKSELCGLTLDQADALENFVLEHGIRGPAWVSSIPWEDPAVAPEDDDLEPAPRIAIDPLRRKIAEPLQRLREMLQSPQRVRTLATAIFEVLREFKSVEILSRWISNARASDDVEQAAEHEQVWDSFTELLDQLVELLGEETVSGDVFLTIVEAGLEQFDLALTPPTLDQVLVGDLDRTRTPDVRGVLLLGLNEGEFPRRPGDRSAFSDRERLWLDHHGIILDSHADRKLLDERFLGYVALTSASERLCVLRCTANDAGGEEHPSSFWNLLRERFPGISVRQIGRAVAQSVPCLGTHPQARTWLLAEIRRCRQSAALAPDAAVLYQMFATGPKSMELQEAWKSLSYNNTPRLHSAIAGQLFPSPLRASVTRIETFAGCAYRHFLRYGLVLRPRDDTEMSPLRLGNLYHGVLERYVHRMLAAKKNWLTLVRDGDEELIRTLTDEVAADVCDAVLIEETRTQFLFRIVRSTVQRVISTHVEAAKFGKTQPLAVEMTFGMSRSKWPALELKTPAGNTVLIEGKIDRIDRVGEDALAIVDYKTGGRSLSLSEVQHKLALQLLTYLVVAREFAPLLKIGPSRFRAAAALYVQLIRRVEATDDPKNEPSPDTPDFDLQVKPRGLINADFIESFDNTGSGKVISGRIKKDGEPELHRGDLATGEQLNALLDQVRSTLADLGDQIIAGNIDVAPYLLGMQSPCPNCEYRSVCRFDLGCGNRYTVLQHFKRQAVLEAAVQAARPARKGKQHG